MNEQNRQRTNLATNARLRSEKANEWKMRIEKAKKEDEYSQRIKLIN